MLTPLTSLLLAQAPIDDKAATAFIAAFAGVYLLILLAAVAGFAFLVFCFWRIFTKTGHGGALALLLLIPGFGLWIAIGVLAFSDWPALRGAPRAG